MYFILGETFFKIPKNLIASTFFLFFFFGEADTKKHRLPPQKPRILQW